MVAAMALATPASAQEGDASGTGETTADSNVDTQSVTIQELEGLVTTLEDPDQRAAFLGQLKALIEAEKERQGFAAGTTADSAAADTGETADSGGDGDIVGDIAEKVGALDQDVGALLHDVDDGGDLLAWVAEQVEKPADRDAWLTALWQMAAILACGLAGALVLRFLLRGQRRRIEGQQGATWSDRLLMAFFRLLLRIAPVVVFAGVAHALIALLEPPVLTDNVASTFVNAIAIAQVLLAVARCVTSPLLANVRPIPLGDETAAYLYIWTARFVVVGVYGFFIADLLVTLGIPDSSYELIERLIGLIIGLMAFVLILQLRQPVAGWIREQSDGGAAMIRNRLADIWHIFAVLMVVLVYVVYALNLKDDFTYVLRAFAISTVVFFVALLLSTGQRRLFDRIFRVDAAFRTRFPGLKHRVNRYVSVLTWFVSALIWIIAAVVILEAWRIDVLSLLASPEGAHVIGRVIATVIIIIIAIVVWELGDGALTNYVTSEGDHTASPRLITLLPLLRNVLLVTICTIVIITILSELGVDIGPLLAGAGVIGLAIGFGAQALVRDVITGAFILFEDQVQIGDFVEAGGKMGTVESLSIRTLKMRDLDGYVHTVPFGEVTAVTNMTRDYGYAVIDVGVAYQENTDHVLDVIKDVDRVAREDTEFAEHLIGDLEVFGVNSLDDSAVTLRVRIKTVAGYQWGVRREYLRRIKLRFDKEGIEIPFPHMSLYFGEVRKGRTPPAHVRIDAEDTEPPPQDTSTEPDPSEAEEEHPEVHGDIAAKHSD